jgi:hypothetical protein
MPAVTVDDILQVAALSLVDTAISQSRPVVSITTAPSGYEGEGFPVRRAFYGVDQSVLDPFIMMDQMGEVDYAPGEPKGTPWHPHRGFETVTYIIDGIFEHQDSMGGGGVIANGATQWMTAGCGILHIERPPEHLVASGGLFHGIQLWVNLPADLKMTAPRYQNLEPDRVVLTRSTDGGALVRVIAGEVDGFAGPGTTHTPIALAHATVAPGAQLHLPWNPAYNALVYVLAGRGSVGSNGDGQTAATFKTGQLAVLGAGDFIAVSADSEQDLATPALEVLVLGGVPIGQPVAWMGPFVMNTQDQLRQAIEDFQAGRMGQIPDN